MQESTKETPFYMLYGRDPRLPLELRVNDNIRLYSDGLDYTEVCARNLKFAWQLVAHYISRAQEKQQQNYNANASKVQFAANDVVYYYDPKIPKHAQTRVAMAWTLHNSETSRK